MNVKGPEAAGEVIIYQADDGQTTLDVRLEAETVWLNLNQMADLFQRDKSVISRHISGIFKVGELERDSVVADFATTAADGKTYRVALSLLVAESEPSQKDLMIRLIMNLLAEDT